MVAVANGIAAPGFFDLFAGGRFCETCEQKRLPPGFFDLFAGGRFWTDRLAREGSGRQAEFFDLHRWRTISIATLTYITATISASEAQAFSIESREHLW